MLIFLFHFSKSCVSCLFFIQFFMKDVFHAYFFIFYKRHVSCLFFIPFFPKSVFHAYFYSVFYNRRV